MKYQDTHPWLDFAVKLDKLPASLWIALGECQSKCEHIAGVPLRPEVERALHRIYLAKGVLASTAIEGNTLTESEVIQHLEGKLQLPPSKDYLRQEIDNIVAACKQIGNQIIREQSPSLTDEQVKDLNCLVLKNLALDEAIVPGAIRTFSIGVGNYKAVPPEDCQYLLRRFCDWLNEDFRLPAENRIVMGVIKAVLSHVYFVLIHPFGDGNGRTARLIEFYILLEAGVPTPAAHLLSNHYNETRQQYYRELDRISKTKGDTAHFLKYAVQGFLDQLKEQLKQVKSQQWDIIWKNYIHEKFRDEHSPASVRQRYLALDLSDYSEPVPLSRIPQLTPRLAIEYAKKTKRTLTRDINKLCDMELIEKTKNGVQVRRDQILAFLPARRLRDHE